MNFKLFILGVFLSACSNNQPAVSSKKYFDLTAFFKHQGELQRSQNKEIEKTVSHNNQSQTKVVLIKDWDNEFELFSASDINKPAWKDSYRISNVKNVVEYNAIDTDLKTRRIRIVKSTKGIKQISIYNRTINTLYNSTEELHYYPDSLYLINKIQKVLLMGTNHYTISGKINKKIK